VFEGLQNSVQGVLEKLKGVTKIKPEHIEEALVSLRSSLLEADVQLKVADRFLVQVRERALGSKVAEGLNPYQQFLTILYKEMLATFGETKAMDFSFKPPVILMMIGLQGSGKTTSSAKLAVYAKRKLKRKPLLVSVDVRRPAAIEQLERLAKETKTDYFQSTSMIPLERAQQAIKYAQTYGLDFVIIDTAGRLSIDDEMMKELQELKVMLTPHHLMYVADSMSGQQALQMASDFSTRVGLTDAILSKADGDARGGVAFSIREALRVPLQFVGTGEKFENFEVFHPDRWCSRILGMGDIASLVEKAEEVSAEGGGPKKDDVVRIMKGQLTLLDFQEQMKMMKKMGSLGSLMGMIPGMGQMAKQVDTDQVEKRMKRIDAMINSMTPKERKEPDVLNGDRKRRVAKGSGVSVEEINQFLREFVEMQKLMKRFAGGKGLMRGMNPFSR